MACRDRVVVVDMTGGTGTRFSQRTSFGGYLLLFLSGWKDEVMSVGLVDTFNGVCLVIVTILPDCCDGARQFPGEGMVRARVDGSPGSSSEG